MFNEDEISILRRFLEDFKEEEKSLLYTQNEYRKLKDDLAHPMNMTKSSESIMPLRKEFSKKLVHHFTTIIDGFGLLNRPITQDIMHKHVVEFEKIQNSENKLLEQNRGAVTPETANDMLVFSSKIQVYMRIFADFARIIQDDIESQIFILERNQRIFEKEEEDYPTITFHFESIENQQEVMDTLNGIFKPVLEKNIVVNIEPRRGSLELLTQFGTDILNQVDLKYLSWIIISLSPAIFSKIKGINRGSAGMVAKRWLLKQRKGLDSEELELKSCIPQIAGEEKVYHVVYENNREEFTVILSEKNKFISFNSRKK